MMDEIPNDNSEDPVDWKLCIFCQGSNASLGELVLNSKIDSYKKVLDVVFDRARVHDGQFVAIQRRLQGCTKEMLLQKKMTWHRSCYSSATHQTKVQRARDRFEYSMSSGHYPEDKCGCKRSSTEMEANRPQTSTPFTRSATNPLLNTQCFFCQQIMVKLSSNLELRLQGRHSGRQLIFPKIQC